MSLKSLVLVAIGSVAAIALVLFLVDRSKPVRPVGYMAEHTAYSIFRKPQPPGIGPVAPGPVPSIESYEEMQQHVARVRMAESYVPPLEDVSFGPNVSIYRFKPTWVAMDATIIGRSLYVVYEVTKSSRLDLVAELTKDALRPIQLPRDYAGMSFIDNGTLVQGIRPLGGVDWFELRGTQAIPVARTRPQPDSNTLYTLTDGNRCEDGAPGSGVAILEVDGHGRARPLLTSAALKAATGGILDEGWAVSCRHFDGEDFATFNTGLTIIFRIANGHATPFATGEIMASNDDVLLLRNNDYVLLEARVIH